MDKLKALGNSLETLSLLVDFEMFRDLLETNLYNVSRDSQADARSFDVILMFKIMFLQRFYGLSDESVEYQIKAGKEKNSGKKNHIKMSQRYRCRMDCEKRHSLLWLQESYKSGQQE